MVVFLMSNLPTIIGTLLLLTLCGCIICKQIKAHKAKKNGCGCGCAGCTGHCNH